MRLRKPPFFLFVIAILLISLVLQTAHGKTATKTGAKSGGVRLDLLPTSLRYYSEREKDQGGRRVLQYAEHGAQPNNATSSQPFWFHPHVRGVYVSTWGPDHQPEDSLRCDDENITQCLHRRRRILSRRQQEQEQHSQFLAYRHLSRYERQYRQKRNLEEFASWDGNYDTALFTAGHKKTTIHRHRSRIKHEGLGRGRRARMLSSASISSGQDATETVTGGQFNHYQAVPLSQGYGTHYVHLWVGSPIPQRQSVIVDTGSHFAAFPCQGCKDCGQEHHTDPHFDPSQSESFHALQCPSECQESAVCRPAGSSTGSQVWDRDNNGWRHRRTRRRIARSLHSSRRRQLKSNFLSSLWGSTSSLRQAESIWNDKCYFTQSYTEGSSWQAYQARDVVYAGGPDVLEAANPLDRHYSLDFMFGCLERETGLFVTQLADGIMGMSAHETTFPKQLYNQGKLEYNMFAMCFRKELGTSKRGVTAGSMTLGGVSSSLDTSPMVYAENIHPYGWFTVSVQNMYVAKNGGTQFLMDSEEKLKDIVRIPIDIDEVNSGKGVIVDSGTTDTYLNSNLMPAFVSVWKQVTGMDYTHAPVYLTRAQLKRLPSILLQCKAARAAVDIPLQQKPVLGQVGLLDPERSTDVLLVIPAENYMEYSPTLKLYTSRLYFTETRGGVLGANAMQGHNVLFDWQHGRIGFSQSSCNYDLVAKEDHENFAGETQSGEDCALRPPILTTTCKETVDISICEDSGATSNVDVIGTEVWTFVVEAAGTSKDSCSNIITRLSDHQNLQMDPSIVECSFDGLCREIRPCHISCTQLLQEQKSPTEATNIGPDSTISTTFGDDCEDSSWSACDHYCKQTSLKAMAVSSGSQVHCQEISRDTRECHVDSCGRADPCMVPFLVHVILILETEKVVTKAHETESFDWSQGTLEEFRKHFTQVSHREEFSSIASRRSLFTEGDVDILISRPWYADEEDEEQEAILEEDHREAKGVQLILQISIFNPKALEAPGQPQGRKLLQEVGAMWRDFSYAFRGDVATFACNPKDLYPLAKDAVELANGVFEHPNFTTTLAKKLSGYSKVRLVSVWTIGTQVYDERVNYYGPIAMSPYMFVFHICYDTALVCFGISVLSFVIQTAYAYRHVARSSVRRWFFKKPTRYHEVSTQEEAFTLSPSYSASRRDSPPKKSKLEVEMTFAQSFTDTHKKSASTTTKRYNSLPHTRSMD